MSETQRTIGSVDNNFIVGTCIADEKEKRTIGVIDQSEETTTCLLGGQMGYREIQFDIAKGAYKQFVIQLENNTDISKAREIKFTLKAHFADDDTLIILQKDHDETLSRLSEGKIVFVFDPNDTKTLDPMTYWFDVWVFLTTNEQYQVAIGQLNIRRNVWRR